jgi:hypothetical protein
VKEVQVIKFDNYDNVDGEQKIFNHTYPKDTTEMALHFDVAYAVQHFSFPPPNDTLTKLLAHQKTPVYQAAVYDEKKRIQHYYRNAKEHYEFEYNSFGNLQYIKRWGAKHVTAQITFIYLYY